METRSEAPREKVLGMKYSGNCYFDERANNGLGEYKAYMVLVKEGHEADARDKMRAFSSAGIKNGIRVRDGVVALGLKQIDMRLKALEEQIRIARGEK